MSKLQRIFILPDAHWPYHNKAAWALAIKAAKVFKPDILINLGDCFDFNAVMSHPRSPSKAKNRLLLAEELARTSKAIPSMESIGAKRNIFITGNHEHRMHRYITDRCPELHGTIPDFRTLVGLGPNWELVPYSDYAKVGRVYYTHDVDGRSGMNAVRDCNRMVGHSIVIGHTHRIDMRVLGMAIGSPQVMASFGWLGDTNQISYMHAISRNREWAAGFGIGYMERDGTTHLKAVPIVGQRCVLEGQVIRR